MKNVSFRRKLLSYRDCTWQHQPHSTWSSQAACEHRAGSGVGRAGCWTRTPSEAGLRGVWSEAGWLPRLQWEEGRAQLSSVGLWPPLPAYSLLSRPRNYLKRFQFDSRAPLGWVLLFLCFNDSSQPLACHARLISWLS